MKSKNNARLICQVTAAAALVLVGNAETRVPFLRQQVKKREGRANLCLADFIDPDGEDWIGGFAVGIHGIEPHLVQRRIARALTLAVTNSFTSASGQITVPMSRPSSTAPPG